MPRTFKCSFCGRNFNNTTGLMHVKNDGTIVYLCSRRCRVSMLSFKRDPRKMKWTEYYGKREKGR
ncbi:50S ribosomal protein L24 [Candidatus Bathyarchaeota archaeon]|jgi:large subunit ribosomal protein L24e|nr:MAG: 50S ribosomal protein L24 [Candidatus Bathyarchaeota archaeon]TMI62207.1 MAG: 50S ribosomal protein L24 [Candidatus Bathyarchaeota archaeon]